MSQHHERGFFLQPLSPLVFRSGRPFGAVGAAGGEHGQPFPLPGAVAGSVRAAWCEAAGHRPGDEDTLISQIAVHGPLRCTRRDGKEPLLWLPAPADARVERQRNRTGGVIARRLSPTPAAAGTGCDMPGGLLPLMSPVTSQLEAPAPWWTAAAVARWLQGSAATDVGRPNQANALPRAERTHIAIDESRQSRDGALFQSSGLNFTEPAGSGLGQPGLWIRVRWPYASNKSGRASFDVATVEKGFDAMTGHPWRIGADGGCAVFDDSPIAVSALDSFKSLGKQLNDLVKVGSVLRMYLATPAAYGLNGWYPDGLVPNRPSNLPEAAFEQVGRPAGRLVGMPPGWRVELVGAAVDRFLPQGSLKRRSLVEAPPQRGRGVQRPAKGGQLLRLVPAGSMYWLKVLAVGDKFDWNSLLLEPSCRVENGRDGLGLALYSLATDCHID